ncbi:hypothetical protein SRABI128_05160 [Microbacterium sp. Bi128]|nr:hypothetical protein SRABI128_05160 [Microbacterium sp. Bi128]
MRVRVGEDAGLQHLVRGGGDARHEVRRREGGLLDLREVVLRVLVQLHGADLDQRVVRVRPHLGEVEGVEAVRLGVLVRHDLDVEVPGGEVAGGNVFLEVADVEVAVGAGKGLGLVAGHGLDALVGLEVVLDPEPLALGVDPLVGVRAVALHFTPGGRQAAVTHEPGDLVGGLGGEGPEVPLHVGVAQVSAGEALLGVDEVRELDPVADEEHGSVVADEVVVALGGVELHGETAGVAPGVGGAGLAGNGGETDEHVRLNTGLEQCGLGELRDVLGGLEGTEGAAALGVHDALRDALAVELRELLDQVVIGQDDRAVGADGLGVGVGSDGSPGLCRGHGGRRDDLSHSSPWVGFLSFVRREAVGFAGSPGRCPGTARPRSGWSSAWRPRSSAGSGRARGPRRIRRPPPGRS